jgi:predicted site-specific integrase-resolvase
MANWVKALEVITKYKISRPTLKYWKDRGWIKSKYIHDRLAVYDLDSVLSEAERVELAAEKYGTTAPEKVKPRLNIVYARVPADGTKTDLLNQLVVIKSYTSSKNINIDKTLIDVGSGISNERKEFNNLLKLVCEEKVDTVYLLCQDRLTRFGFNIIETVFKNFGTKIELVATDEFQNETLVQELFEDLENLLKNYCMKVSGEAQTKLNEIIEFLGE